MVCRLCSDKPPANAPLCDECAEHPLLVAAPHWAATIQLAEDVGTVRADAAVALL